MAAERLLEKSHGEEPLYQNTMGQERHEFMDTPAYEMLRKENLLCTKYRLQSANEIEAIPSNSTPWVNLALNVGCMCCRCCFLTFETPSGYVALVEDGRGQVKILKSHAGSDYYYYYNSDYCRTLTSGNV